MIVVLVSAVTEWNVVRKRYPEMVVQRSPFSKWGCVDFSDTKEKVSVVFFHGGWGKVRAAASTQFVIDKYVPELVINLGTCGGLSGDVKPGEIILAESTVIYDIHERMYDPKQAVAEYTTSLKLDWIQSPPIRVKRSVLVSADSDLDPKLVNSLRTKYHSVAGDWESGAIAYICHLSNIPCLILRGVSDLVTSEHGEAYEDPGVFLARTSKIMDNLLNSLPQWIDMFHEHTAHNNAMHSDGNSAALHSRR